MNGTQCGREEDRSATDLAFADFCNISLMVLFKRKEQEYVLDYKIRENKMLEAVNCKKSDIPCNCDQRTEWHMAGRGMPEIPLLAEEKSGFF